MYGMKPTQVLAILDGGSRYGMRRSEDVVVETWPIERDATGQTAFTGRTVAQTACRSMEVDNASPLI